MTKLPERFSMMSPLHLALAAQKQAPGRAIINAEPIAVIGMACRFPGGVTDPESFWRLLRNGVDVVTEVPPSRWDIDALYDPNPDAAGKITTRYGSFLDNVDLFDPAFFGITPREANWLDPQQRLLLEASWESLERAGIAPARLRGSQTGVFIGMMTQDYAYLTTTALEQIDTYTGMGALVSAAAGRIAYILGLHGPTMTVDTACSSSLVTVHLACQSLRMGECDLALAGGVNLMLTPHLSVMESRLHVFAADGHCKTFDAAADGMVRGEGCGMIVLKRLSDAVADGDPIFALIRGSAVNHDGRSSGLTVPNGPAQERVIQQALDNGGVTPHQVHYIEAHGTGTALGDPIEVGALQAIYGRNRATPLVVGSLKTNMGHLEGAAGIAGLMKVILALHHAEIPPNLHFHQPSPHIPWQEYHIAVPNKRQSWPTGDRRLAAVSSFGLSGTNAHIVLEATPAEFLAQPTQPEGERPMHLLTLSATTENALRDLAQRHSEQLATIDAPVADLCFTTHVGRVHFSHRLAIVADTHTALREKLASVASGKLPPGFSLGQTDDSNKKIAFLFTGQGAQYVNMGRELYTTSPTFRATLEHCDALLRTHLGESLLNILYPATSDHSSMVETTASQRIDDTTYTQPALFMLEYALAMLWQSWGIQPDLLIGHSVGELAAACVAGVFSLEDGLKLVAARGRLMGALPQDGEMVAIMATEQRVRQAIAAQAKDIAIAAVNGPESIVIAGKRTAVLAIAEQLASDGVKTHRLIVSHAFHSPLMEPMLAHFRTVAQTITYHKPQLRLVANLTGQLAGDEIATAEYWVRHLRETVRFADGLATLREQGATLFLEIGPKPVLLGMADQPTNNAQASTSRYLPSLRKGQSDWQQLLTSLGELYVGGVAIDWQGFDKDYPRRKIVLPTYPFQRQRYWVDAPKKRQTTALRPLIDKMTQSPAIKEILFETEFSVEALPFLADHRVYGEVVSPGACQISMALNAAALAFGQTQGLQLDDVVLPQAFVFPADGARTAQAIFTPVAANGDAAHYTVNLISFAAESPGERAGCEMATHMTANATCVRPITQRLDLTALRHRCGQPFDLVTFYDNLVDGQITLGPAFRWLEALWHSHTPSSSQPYLEALAQLRTPETQSIAGDDLLPLGLLDACFQVAGATRVQGEQAETLLPFALESLHLQQAVRGNAWWCHATQVAPYKWDIQLLDSQGSLVATITGFEACPAKPEAIQRKEVWRDWLYRVTWEAQPRPQTNPTGAAESRLAGQRWLIFADQQGVGATLADQLRQQGAQALLVYADISAAASPQPVDASTYQLHPARADQVSALLAAVTSAGALHGVVHLWSLDAPEVTRADDLETAARLGCDIVLSLVQTLLQQGVQPAGLWLVTQGTQAVQAGDAVVGVAQSTLWGMGKVIALEHPELACVCVDLDEQAKHAAAQPSYARQLLQEMTTPPAQSGHEAQVSLREGQRYVARLVRHPQPPPADTLVLPDTPYQLTIRERGTLENLQLTALARRIPAPDEVEVAVQASGLNFRDVLNIMGLYPGEAGAIGVECAGVVTAVGAMVKHLNVGDKVIGLCRESFSQYVTDKAYRFARIPTEASLVAGATIPVAFLTVYYGLHHLAAIKAGDRILIHAATGGVGQAAVQYAHYVGAEVYGTASPGKWQSLREMGVTHIYNSRSLDFAEQILSDTGGRGVDIVLNSLTGEGFIEATLSVLAAHGRFIEIGKREIWSTAQMAAARPDICYCPFDLGEVVDADPALMTTMFHDLMTLFATKQLAPLPQTCFPIQQAIAAFRYMQQAKHVGKIVLIHSAQREVAIRSDASYLISGGLGGLGLEVAKALAAQGASHLVLMGRSRPTPTVQAQLDALTTQGVTVTVVQANVTDKAQVQQSIAQIDPAYPLRGIVHAAGILADGALLHQTWDSFVNVLAPKVQGTWHLHETTQTLPLDFFVVFSSAASLLGNRGQVNYAAANAFLDAFAHYRRAQGLPALSLNWGSWSEVGLAAHLSPQQQAQMRASGLEWIAPQQGIQILAYLLQETICQPGDPQVGVVPIHWTTFLSSAKTLSPFYAGFAKFAQPPLTSEESQLVSQRLKFQQQLAAASTKERKGILLQALGRAVIQVLQLPTNDQIAPEQELTTLGLDSLMAIELRNHICQQLPMVKLAITDFIGTSLERLATQIEEQYQQLAPSIHQPESLSVTMNLNPTEPAESHEEVEEFLV